jgi:hypothetical protein
MFELWFTEKSLKNRTAKPIGTHQTEDGNPTRYHNFETAKSQAKIVQEHPAFKNSATVLIYDVAKDRFIKP